MTISECSIKVFMECLCNKKYDGVGGFDNWNSIYTEYIDLSGSADTKECSLKRTILDIELRLSFINSVIEVNIRSLNAFNLPFPGTIEDIKNYGHHIAWNGDKEDFVKQLKKIERRESKRIAEREGLIKELNQLVKEGMKATNVKENDRKNFLVLLNGIGKHQGYGIDKDKTMMDEFSLMVKSRKDEYEALMQKK